MITMSGAFKQSDIDKLEKLFDGNAKKARQQLHIAVKKTAASTKSKIAREIKKRSGLKTVVIKKFIRVKVPNRDQPKATIIVRDSAVWLSLRHYSPRQVSDGTKAKIDPQNGQTMIQSAFMGPKPGIVSIKLRGNVFKRTGSKRKPIELLRAPDPVDVFNANGMEPSVVTYSKDELKKNVERRIQFLTAKQQGLIK